jgi:hypothetical protein
MRSELREKPPGPWTGLCQIASSTGGNLQDHLTFSSVKYDIDVTHQRDESYADIG